MCPLRVLCRLVTLLVRCRAVWCGMMLCSCWAERVVQLSVLNGWSSWMRTITLNLELFAYVCDVGLQRSGFLG